MKLSALFVGAGALVFARGLQFRNVSISTPRSLSDLPTSPGQPFTDPQRIKSSVLSETIPDSHFSADFTYPSPKSKGITSKNPSANTRTVPIPIQTVRSHENAEPVKGLSQVSQVSQVSQLSKASHISSTWAPRELVTGSLPSVAGSAAYTQAFHTENGPETYRLPSELINVGDIFTKLETLTSETRQQHDNGDLHTHIGFHKSDNAKVMDTMISTMGTSHTLMHADGVSSDPEGLRHTTVIGMTSQPTITQAPGPSGASLTLSAESRSPTAITIKHDHTSLPLTLVTASVSSSYQSATNIPSAILPGRSEESTPGGFVGIQIVFLYPLNYIHIVENTVAASQIFQYLPRALSESQNISPRKIRVTKLIPFEKLEYLATLAAVDIPKGSVDSLQDDMSEGFGHVSESVLKTLLALVNTQIPVQNTTTPEDQDESKQKGQQLVTAGICVGTVIGATSFGMMMFKISQRYKKRSSRTSMAST